MIASVSKSGVPITLGTIEPPAELSHDVIGFPVTPVSALIHTESPVLTPPGDSLRGTTRLARVKYSPSSRVREIVPLAVSVPSFTAPDEKSQSASVRSI